MQRRHVLALTASLGTGGIAGCLGFADNEDQSGTDDNGDGGVPDYRDVYEEGADPDSETDEEALNDLKEFYTAWLHHDVERMFEYLHEPRMVFLNANYFEQLGDSDPGFDVEIDSLNATLFDDDVTEEEFLTMAGGGDPLPDDEVREITSTPTREYILNPVLTDTPDPENELEEQTIEAIQGEAHRIVSEQDGRWKVV